jgi:hypothetical protein
MRQYLYLFWGLLLAGMIILTAAHPGFRQAAGLPYPGNRDYAVYDRNGERLLVSGGDISTHIRTASRPACQSRF